MIEARVICDSISENGNRLTTFKLRYPRFIHSEFLTHRVISRNASGSRAVPTAKLLEEARSDSLRASPIFWGKNQRGMQAIEECNNHIPISLELGYLTEGKTYSREAAWKDAAECAAEAAECFAAAGYHKQIVNRLLEPFVHINVVATATEWDNFFGLRLHRDAQPEIQALARQMWSARQLSKPLLTAAGVWHLPFVSEEERHDALLRSRYVGHGNSEEFDYEGAQKELIKISVARCARVSYESFETGRRSTVEEDLRLFDRLLGEQPLHASPAEHQARPDQWSDDGTEARWVYPELHGNFVGWVQFRKTLSGESCAPLPDELLPF